MMWDSRGTIQASITVCSSEHEPTLFPISV
jgi:hypothetical protein